MENGTVGIMKKPPQRRRRARRATGDLRKFAEAACAAKVGDVITYGRASTGIANCVLIGVEAATGRRFSGYKGKDGIAYHERVK